ncbi:MULTISPECIES: DeoR/GlpR family DNA-binding transcription regulator [unclassified Amycolatopsis]|uniref:DeoR/GlpR family DNA-binding transcription regulator n=1 Tax=unclassified Amycolatopsis TaxID=2618356 RepID=UPI002E1C9823|nr:MULTISPECIES: DeoR/GlpR family DNA-binding transcription regulator [unclassified Amycolatopsis]
MLLEAVRDGSGGITQLAEEFGVSESTIRRDLASLAGAGHVVRTYGGALETGADRGPQEKDQEYAAARDAIARKAAAVVRDGEVVLLDAGAVTGRLARHLAHREGLTVVTNSVTAIRELAGFPGIDLIVLGGRLRHPAEAILGETVLAQLRHVSPDRVFLGTDGMVSGKGLCCPSLEQSVVKHAMLHAGTEAYVLADQSQLGQAPFPYWAPLDREFQLVTNRTSVDVRYSPFAESGGVLLAGVPETVGGGAHHGPRGC